MAKTSSLTRLAGLLATGLLIAPAAASADEGQILREGAADAIPGSYIVVMDDGTTRSEVTELVNEHDADVEHRFTSAVNGFAAEMTREEALDLSTDPAVEYVEQNRELTATATQAPTPSWGLDRIDQRDLPLSNAFTYANTGAGVTAYIIDTGIRTTHTDFGGRASWGTNTTGDGQNTDCNGHGTHVAGTVGGSTYGVAKGVKLVAVKVLNCAGSGTTAGVIAGVDWVTSRSTGPSVANMSLGGGASQVLDEAVRRSIARGVTYAIAAGNDSGASACNTSPARTPEAITVGSTTNTDARSSFSNIGTCVDLFAPGSGITSAWNTSDTATNTLNGTSMATPHVAGAAALVLGVTPTATPATVVATLVNNATVGKITNPGTGSPNRLLNSGNAPTTPTPGACNTFTNATDVSVPDNTTVTSLITVAGCNRNASAATEISVDIRHTYRGDLVVEAIAPNGTIKVMSNRAGGSADNLTQTFVVDMSSSPANGTWTLRVRDAASGDTGFINSWSVKP